jgi:hypothetical protein
MQNDIPSRLWKICFYARIASWRKKLIWEKKKYGSGGTSMTMEHHSKTQESYSIFLSEGVTLYQYLIGMLHQKLLTAVTGKDTFDDGGASTSYSQTSSSSSVGLPTVASPPPGTDMTLGIVPALTACHLCLGDLLRYSENITQATKAYRMAASLAPGHGHAYNQLAVLCQQHPPSSSPPTRGTKSGGDSAAGGGPPYAAVAFYWYARALLVTTNDPFSIAVDNLTRLLQSNHTWVMEQPPQNSTTRTSTATATTVSSQPDTRRFLAMWVDLHYSFYQCNDDKMDEILHQIDTVMDHLTTTASALGDALLCRLVTIHVFSECFLDRPNGVPSSLMMTLARIATYQLGIRLVDQVRQGWTKASTGSSSTGGGSSNMPTKIPSSVRLLPIWLLAAYTSRISMPSTDHDGAAAALETARTRFWRGWLAMVQTVEPWVRSSMKEQMRNDMNDDDDDDDNESSILTSMGKLKSLVELRGFGPFASFLPKAIDNDGYLSPAQACETLQSETSSGKSAATGRISETASTTTSHSTTENNKDTGRLKMMGLVHLADQLVEDTDGLVGRRIVRERDTGTLVWKDMEGLQNDSNYDDDGAAIPMDEDSPVDRGQAEATVEMEEENVLEYKAGADGGPALLVPTMLLQKEITHEVVKATSPPTVQKSPANSEASENLLPVFDATPVNLHETTVPLSVPQPTDPAAVAAPAFHSVTAGIRLPPPGMEPVTTNLPPPPGFGQPAPVARTADALPSVMLGQSHLPTPTQQPETLGEAMRLYGQQLQQQTSNPFANPLPPTATGFTEAFPYSASAPAPSDFWGSTSDPSAGVSLLDSGLLKSLWTGDSSSKSRNPFAT